MPSDRNHVYRLLTVSDNKYSEMLVGFPLGYYSIVQSNDGVTVKNFPKEIIGRAWLLSILTVLCILHWSVLIYYLCSTTALHTHNGVLQPWFWYIVSNAAYTALLILIWRAHLNIWKLDYSSLRMPPLNEDYVTINKNSGFYSIIIPEEIGQNLSPQQVKTVKFLRKFLSSFIVWANLLGPFEFLAIVLVCIQFSWMLKLNWLYENSFAFLAFGLVGVYCAYIILVAAQLSIVLSGLIRAFIRSTDKGSL